MIFYAGGVGVHVDEDESGIFFQTHRNQLRFVAIEIGDVFAVTCMGQVAIEFECPCVIRAGITFFAFPSPLNN